MVEFVDIYPSLNEAAGLSQPAHLDLEGQNFMPLVWGEQADWENIAVSQFSNGLTLIKEHYFYNEYSDEDGNIQARMLYDHWTDPKETNNLAADSSNSDLVKRLSKRMQKKRGADY